MWLELEHTTHQRFLQFAAVRQLSFGFEYGVVFFTALLSVSWKMGATSLLVVLVPRLGGLGRQNFCSTSFLSGDPTLCWQQRSSPFTETSRCWGRTLAGWWSFSTASGSGSRPILRFFLCSGAACRCWLGTWPHDPLPWGSMPLLV